MRLRSAVAAAAEERLVEEGCDWRKAWEAADWADCDEVVERGYNISYSIQHSRYCDV